MNPDLEKRVLREILAELIEEGTEAFRGILEKLFNVAMQLERSEFLGAEAYERTKSRRGYRNGFKGKRIQTRVGELHNVVQVLAATNLHRVPPPEVELTVHSHALQGARSRLVAIQGDAVQFPMML